jgi:hypothetical protein
MSNTHISGNGSNGRGAFASITGKPPRTGIQRKSRFSGKVGRVSEQKRTLFQVLARQIRYVADQWNFSRDQRIRAALTTEKQRKVGAPEKNGNAPALHRSLVDEGFRDREQCQMSSGRDVAAKHLFYEARAAPPRSGKRSPSAVPRERPSFRPASTAASTPTADQSSPAHPRATIPTRWSWTRLAAAIRTPEYRRDDIILTMARVFIGDAAGKCRVDHARGNVDPTGARTPINPRPERDRGERVRTNLLSRRLGRDNEALIGDPPPPRHRLMTHPSV